MRNESTIGLRISSVERSRWVNHAKAKGIKVSRLVREAVRAAIEGDPTRRVEAEPVLGELIGEDDGRPAMAGDQAGGLGPRQTPKGGPELVSQAAPLRNLWFNRHEMCQNEKCERFRIPCCSLCRSLIR